MVTRLAVPKTYKLYIGGKFPRSESGRTYEVVTKQGAFLANAAKASRKDARDAVVAARAAVAGWSGATAYNRGQVLYRIAELLEGRRDQFIDEVALSEGIPKPAATKQVDTAIDAWVWYAGWADKYVQAAGNANPVERPLLQPLHPRADRRGRDRRTPGQFASRPGGGHRAGDPDGQHGRRDRQRGRTACSCQPLRSARDERRSGGSGEHPHGLTRRDRPVARRPRRRERPSTSLAAEKLEWVDLQIIAADTLKRRAAPGGGRPGPVAPAHRVLHRDENGLAHEVDAVTVVVVGSANLDQVFRVDSIPAPGETVMSRGLSTAAGGKGQNQAVAAARAGAQTTFIAALGGDAFGENIRSGLVSEGIDVSLVRTVDAPTGTALIAVDDRAENTIIVEAGANALLTGLTDADRAAITGASVLVMQLEIPLETVMEAADAAAGSSTVILNAAPIRDLPKELLAKLDVLVVNEHEAAHLQAAEPGIALEQLVKAVIVTMGAEGAVLRRAGEADVAVASPKVTPVDTTGAGDTFCGALGASIDRGESLEEALKFAVVAGSLAVQTAGAVPSIPTREAIVAASV